MDKNFITKFLKGSLATSLGQIATVLFHFASISVMARYVVVEEYGIYAIILLIALGGKTIGTLGLDLTLIQFLSTRPMLEKRHAISTVLFLRLVVMSLFTILFYAIGSLIFPIFDSKGYGDSLSIYKWILPTIFVLMSFRELFLFVLQGLQQFRNLAMIQTASAILKFLLVWSLRHQLNLTWLLIIEIIMLSSSLGYLIYLIPFKDYRLGRITLNPHSFREIFRFGFPIYINAVVNYVSSSAGQFLIGSQLSFTSVGEFDQAAKMPQGVHRLFDSFRVVYFPTLSQLFASGNRGEAATFMNKTLVILASVTFSGVIFSYLFRTELVQFVLGQRYIEGTEGNVPLVFSMLMLWVCLRLLASTMGYSLVSSGNPQKSTQVNVVAIIFELVLLFLLIPRIGYIGAALASIVTQVLAQTLAFFALNSVGARIRLSEYLKPFVFLISIAALHYFLDLDSILYRLGLLVLYVTLCLTLIDDVREALIYLVKLINSRRSKAAT